MGERREVHSYATCVPATPNVAIEQTAKSTKVTFLGAPVSLDTLSQLLDEALNQLNGCTENQHVNKQSLYWLTLFQGLCCRRSNVSDISALEIEQAMRMYVFARGRMGPKRDTYFSAVRIALIVTLYVDDRGYEQARQWQKQMEHASFPKTLSLSLVAHPESKGRNMRTVSIEQAGHSIQWYALLDGPDLHLFHDPLCEKPVSMTRIIDASFSIMKKIIDNPEELLTDSPVLFVLLSGMMQNERTLYRLLAIEGGWFLTSMHVRLSLCNCKTLRLRQTLDHLQKCLSAARMDCVFVESILQRLEDHCTLPFPNFALTQDSNIIRYYAYVQRGVRQEFWIVKHGTGYHIMQNKKTVDMLDFHKVLTTICEMLYVAEAKQELLLVKIKLLVAVLRVIASTITCEWYFHLEDHHKVIDAFQQFIQYKMEKDFSHQTYYKTLEEITLLAIDSPDSDVQFVLHYLETSFEVLIYQLSDSQDYRDHETMISRRDRQFLGIRVNEGCIKLSYSVPIYEKRRVVTILENHDQAAKSFSANRDPSNQELVQECLRSKSRCRIARGFELRRTINEMILVMILLWRMNVKQDLSEFVSSLLNLPLIKTKHFPRDVYELMERIANVWKIVTLQVLNDQADLRIIDAVDDFEVQVREFFLATIDWDLETHPRSADETEISELVGQVSEWGAELRLGSSSDKNVNRYVALVARKRGNVAYLVIHENGSSKFLQLESDCLVILDYNTTFMQQMKLVEEDLQQSMENFSCKTFVETLLIYFLFVQHKIVNHPHHLTHDYSMLGMLPSIEVLLNGTLINLPQHCVLFYAPIVATVIHAIEQQTVRNFDPQLIREILAEFDVLAKTTYNCYEVSVTEACVKIEIYAQQCRKLQFSLKEDTEDSVTEIRTTFIPCFSQRVELEASHIKEEIENATSTLLNHVSTMPIIMIKNAFLTTALLLSFYYVLEPNSAEYHSCKDRFLNSLVTITGSYQSRHKMFLEECVREFIVEIPKMDQAHKEKMKRLYDSLSRIKYT